MKKTYILSCAAIIISIISMTISIIEMGTEAVTTPDGSISDCVSKESQLLVESKENMVVQLKSEVPETELIKHGTEYVVEKVVIENSGEKYYFIEMFVNENFCCHFGNKFFCKKEKLGVGKAEKRRKRSVNIL